MINPNYQIVWNKEDERPASAEEITNLVNKGWLVLNYSLRSASGVVWIDLDDKAELDFEIRLPTPGE